MEVYISNSMEECLKIEDFNENSFLFYRPEWYECVLSSFKEYNLKFLVFKKEGQVIGFCPLFIRKKLVFQFIYSGFWGTYGGPVGKPEIFKNFLPFLYKKSGIRTMFIQVVDFFNRISPFPPFQEKTEVFYFLNLDEGYEQIFKKKYKKSLREQIRQGLRKGVIVRNFEDKDLSLFQELLEKTYYGKYKRKTPKFLFIQNLWNILGKRGLLKGFIAEVNGRPGSCVFIIVLNKETLLTYLQGNDPEMYQYRVSPLILDRAIKWASEKGYKIFSFGSNPLISEGVSKFKESFGTTKGEYKVYTYTNSFLSSMDYLYRMSHIF